ncbi:IucA/IucC family protein [Staphylococcus massiliensis]|uniref:Sialic acid synthase n=1 Tax=Staphylococcus massiliensis S46 TaxID=1229783 RepID=K9AWH0_9STAP|nr:IucA/IucC family protein [Staphylococcus massiliensis]EKU45845.1 hypothetical protein C273_10657 [Staphylococcus massiliensis S46]MCG3399330.1 IucA/IucC family siderophore biosynthesis protein [Staphylococcus massiliensis]MCG3402568.1 IucA/IucC family siderophore biosynthesis protein [Staphylococcus massiliensis]MCG3413333.1 IucA/IucC family siderophore biosynthesis protein [Staphylococcus massiliensis]POA00670.1 IucA/IucC family siderophore biosynthesis protein [Staphylococcus massiliensis
MKNIDNPQQTEQIDVFDEELHTYNYLNSFNVQWALSFCEHLKTARDKINQRLITSIYRENLVKGYDNSQIKATKDTDLNDLVSQDDVLIIDFPKSDILLHAPIRGEFAFNRVEVEGPFYIQSKDNHQFTRVLHPEVVLNFILTETPELKNDASAQFRSDMENSVANLALAISYRDLNFKDQDETLLTILKASEDSYLKSEQFVYEGHPLHPGAKLRKGMTPEAVIKYSSEFNQPIPLKFLLVKDTHTRKQTYEQSFNDYVFSMFDGLKEQALEVISEDELSHYDVMVVHPWQHAHILEKDYQRELEHHDILEVPYEVTYYAGLSFRTLMPKYPITTPHIKLSTNVHITGEIRTMSEQTTYNGPLVTEIINQIMEDEQIFHNINAEPINEVAGIHFYDKEDQGEHQTIRSEQLGSLFRENLYHQVSKDQLPIIPSALVSYQPNQPETLIVSLVKTYQNQQGIEDYDKASIEWMRTYAKPLIDMVIPLLIKYGIALEAHLQNTIAVFNSKGLLDKMLIRDFEGLRIDRKQLNDMGFDTSHFHEASRILTDSKTSVFNKAFYSTIQNHLGELVLTIVDEVNDKKAQQTLESQIWREISQQIEAKLSEIETLDPSFSEERLTQFREIFFNDVIDYKCVTTMRLEDQSHEYSYVKVDNPLA